MKHAIAVIAVVIPFLSGTALAQHASGTAQEEHAIKSLSAEDAKQYLTGAGMGLARAAELNHYPGPMHVLELAEQLTLTPEQRAATRRLMDIHHAEARGIGAKLIEAERALDRLFASGKVEAAALADHVKAVAALHGDYRLSHLETHRRMRAILTLDQVRAYDQLRGHIGPASDRHDGGAHRKHGH